MHVLQKIRNGLNKWSRIQYLTVVVSMALLSAITTTVVLAAQWSSVAIVPGTADQDFWPHVHVDSEGWVHVVWLDFMDGSAYPFYYTRGKLIGDGTSVSWEPHQQVSSMKVKAAGARVETDSAGVTHIAMLSESGRVYHFYNTQRGTAGHWNSETTTLSDCGWSMDMSVDSAGRTHVVCSLGVGDGNGQTKYSYRVSPGSWMSPISVQGSKGFITKKNRIITTGTGSAIVVHIMYNYTDKEGGTTFAYYSRGGAGGPFAVVNFARALGQPEGGAPALAQDPANPGRLFAGFVNGNIDNGYHFYFSTSANNGASWSVAVPLSLGENRWYGETWFHGANLTAHIASEQKFWNGSGFSTILIYYQEYDATQGSFSVASLISNNEKSTVPRISGGGTGMVTVFVRGNTDNVLYTVSPGGVPSGGVTPSPTPTPTTDPNIPTPTPIPTNTPTPEPSDGTPKGKLQIENDAAMVVGTKAFVTFILDMGKANQYTIWNEGESVVPYTSINTIEGPGGIWVVNGWNIIANGTYACKQVRVYGRLNNTIDNKVSAVFSDDILVDPGVDVTVDVSNPWPGSESYTKEPYYALDVAENSGECNHLARVRVGEKQPDGTLQLAESDVGSLQSTGLMPLIGTAGLHTIIVEVTDGVGNVRTIEKSIMLDTQQPTLVASSGKLSADDSVSMTHVQLDFSDIMVQDDVYGTNADETQPFWGVWVANARTAIPISDTATLDALQWVPLQIAHATVVTGSSSSAYNFTIADWDLFNGVAAEEQTGGSYYVYARLMDGAGNASDMVLQSNQISLSDAFVVPTATPTPTPVLPPQLYIYLPVVSK